MRSRMPRMLRGFSIGRAPKFFGALRGLWPIDQHVTGKVCVCSVLVYDSLISLM